METVQSYFGSEPPQKCYGRKSNSGLLIGIEVELERVQMHTELYGWNNIKDGSLKDNGREFTIPVWNNYAYEYLNKLFASMAVPTASSRCSIHVHADVTQFTLDQIKSLIVLYIIFERALYKYSGYRWNNNYCVPVQTWAMGMDLNHLGFMEIARDFMKYSGLNVFPDEGKLSTVEFRHMVGNYNADYINDWIQIITHLVQFAQKQEYKQILLDIKDMRSNSEYWNLFKAVFGDYAKVLNYSTFNRDVEEGITFVKLITE